MKDYVMQERELLDYIGNKLYEIRAFLIGNIPVEEAESTKEDCFYDSLKTNLKKTEEIRNLTDSLYEVIIGGKN